MDIKEELFEVCGYLCWNEECNNRAEELHHMLSQSKINKRKFPLFIHSPFNLVPLCSICHHGKTLPRIDERLAAVYERFLQELKEGTKAGMLKVREAV